MGCTGLALGRDTGGRAGERAASPGEMCCAEDVPRPCLSGDPLYAREERVPHRPGWSVRCRMSARVEACHASASLTDTPVSRLTRRPRFPPSWCLASLTVSLPWREKPTLGIDRIQLRPEPRGQHGVVLGEQGIKPPEQRELLPLRPRVPAPPPAPQSAHDQPDAQQPTPPPAGCARRRWPPRRS
jgi:hypothetical protein